MLHRFFQSIVVLILGAGSIFATSVDEVPLASQVRDAAFIAVGKVIDVKMKGRFGLPAFDSAAQTGPGSSYSLWLVVEFDRSAMLKGDAERVPRKKMLPLWKGWIKTLKSEREASLGQTFVFFLASDLTPASVHFQHFEFERSEIEAIILRQKKEPNQPPEPTRASAGLRIRPESRVAHL